MKKSPSTAEKDSPTYSSSTRKDTRGGADQGLPPGLPHWVKMFGIIALVLLVLFVILHLTGLGFGGHASSMNHREM